MLKDTNQEQRFNIKIKIFGFIYITKAQFLIIELFFFLFFLSLTIFFFVYRFPEYINDPLILFHKKYLKYVSLIFCVSTLIETNYYLYRYYKYNKVLNEFYKSNTYESYIYNEYYSKFKMAERIQRVILNSSNQYLHNLNYFIIYKPRDVISGDFYLLKEINNKQIIIVADSQGHSVEGALMSIFGITAIDQILNESVETLNSSEILDNLRQIVINSQTKNFNSIDIAIIIIDKVRRIVQFSGAKRPLFLFTAINNPLIYGEKIRSVELFDLLYSNIKIKDKDKFNKLKKELGNKYKTKYPYKLIEIKGDNMSIGKNDKKVPFYCYQFAYKDNDKLYLFSDGIPDLFGGRENKKFKLKRFKLMLFKFQKYSLNTQKQKINQCIEKWRGSNKQTDDIVLIGIKL